MSLTDCNGNRVKVGDRIVLVRSTDKGRILTVRKIVFGACDWKCWTCRADDAATEADSQRGEFSLSSWLRPKDFAVVPPEAKEPAPKKAPANFRPMTDIERVAAAALERVKFPPATSTKRFAQSLVAQAKAPHATITDRQAEHLWRICWTYRRQLPTDVVRDAKARHMGTSASPSASTPQPRAEVSTRSEASPETASTTP